MPDPTPPPYDSLASAGYPRSEPPVAEPVVLGACPFCGSVNGRLAKSLDMKGVIFWVHCPGPCHASGPVADSRLDAVASWNGRRGEAE